MGELQTRRGRIVPESQMKTAEAQIIEKLAKAAVKSAGTAKLLRVGIGDDAALVRISAAGETVLTCDWFLEGTHFWRAKHPADSVGWKCLARAISDIAAMGSAPTCFLLSLALPASATGKWLDQFLMGLKRASRHLRCPLAGGDTTRQDKILINVTVVGAGPRGRAILRSGACPHDTIFVSGRLGEAELGLRDLRSKAGRPSLARQISRKHLYPEPRLALGQWLAQKRIASAMMDLSDGLSSDLPRLCAASGVGAVIDVAKLPLPTITCTRNLKQTDLTSLALHGGDDYELLFTVAPRDLRKVPKLWRGLPLTPIGEIVSGSKILLRDAHGSAFELEPGGWDPFLK